MANRAQGSEGRAAHTAWMRVTRSTSSAKCVVFLSLKNQTVQAIDASLEDQAVWAQECPQSYLQEEKDAVPDHIKQAAREMGEQAFRCRSLDEKR
jgi:hypothetical protein